MNARAHVQSMEAVEQFRSALVSYRDHAGALLEEMTGEVLRTRLWLQQDRAMHWRGQCHARRKNLDELKAAWFRAELTSSGRRGVSEMDMRRAREALRHAEAKQEAVKRWIHRFDSHVSPLAVPLEHLQDVLSGDLVRATARLRSLLRTLDGYLEGTADGEAAPSKDAKACGETS